MPPPVSACNSPPTVMFMPRAQWRVISPGFFAALGVPILTGRDFNDLDGQNKDKDPVVIISETLAQRMFPNQDAINRHVYWTDPVLKVVPGISSAPHHRRHCRY